MPAGAVANQVHCLWRWDGDGVSRCRCRGVPEFLDARVDELEVAGQLEPDFPGKARPSPRLAPVTTATNPLICMAAPRSSVREQRVSRGPVDPGEHESADDYPAGAEDGQPRVGRVQAERQPAGELAQDEQPRSGGNAGGPGGSVGGPER